jgi:glucuronoarabinoxylan endo-1,4-beta-xylanase
MYCATHDGLYQGTSSVSSVGGGNGNPVGWKLEQNYPNPFNPSTTITYELPRAFQVTLTVFDILGREVSVLVNERREAGVHEVKLDASELASGVYLYRLTAGSFVQTKKMLVVK